MSTLKEFRRAKKSGGGGGKERESSMPAKDRTPALANEFEVGDIVEVSGLQNAAHLNGQNGEVVKALNLQTGRIGVKTAGGDILGVKPANLRLVENKWVVTQHPPNPNLQKAAPGKLPTTIRLASQEKITPRYGGRGTGAALPGGSAPFGGLTPEQIQKSSQGTMIYYPVDMDAMMRGQMDASDVVVGHNKVFTVTQAIYADRVRKMFRANQKMAELPEALLSTLEVHPEKELSHGEPGRSQAIARQVAELQKRSGGSETLTLVPLKLFYQRVPFHWTERMLPIFGVEDIADQILSGFRGVTFQTHAHGLPRADGRTPPPEDLTAAIPFGRGLRIQCAFTPLLAIMHVATLFKSLELPERDVFFFPHGIVLATSGAPATRTAVQKLTRMFEWLDAGPSAAQMCCTGARAGSAGGAVPYLFLKNQQSGISTNVVLRSHPAFRDSATFMKRLREEACCLFPFFSDQVPARLGRR